MKAAFRKFCSPDFDDYTLRLEAAPRAGVGFVLEFGNNNLVARFENSRECPCELKRQGCGARADHDFARFAVQELSSLESGLDFDVGCGDGSRVRHPDIARGGAQESRDAIDALLRHLSARRVVQKAKTVLKGWKVCPSVQVVHAPSLIQKLAL